MLNQRGQRVVELHTEHADVQVKETRDVPWRRRPRGAAPPNDVEREWTYVGGS